MSSFVLLALVLFKVLGNKCPKKSPKSFIQSSMDSVCCAKSISLSEGPNNSCTINFTNRINLSTSNVSNGKAKVPLHRYHDKPEKTKETDKNKALIHLDLPTTPPPPFHKHAHTKIHILIYMDVHRAEKPKSIVLLRLASQIQSKCQMW